MNNLESILSIAVAGIPVKLLILSFVILFMTFFVRRYLVKRTLGYLHEFTKKTDNVWDEALVAAIKPPLSLGVLIVGVWLALKVLPLPTKPFDMAAFVHQSGRIVVLLIFMWLVIRLINALGKAMHLKAADPAHWLDTSLVPLIVLALKTLIWITIFVVVAQNLGYSVSGLVASLGIGGVAVALAAQDTLANLFGSVMIMVDKPFRIGDWIKSNEFEGTVEEIGFRSTKIRTFAKTVQVVPNNKIANMMIENMDRRKDDRINVRRVKMTIGLEYKANADQMEAAVEAIKEILRTSENVDQGFYLVHFNEFGDSSLNIFVYFFAATTDWERYLDTRQEVNLKIMRTLEKLGLSIAFPTRTLYLEKQAEKQVAEQQSRETGEI